VQEKGNRDNAASKSYCNSISMVHRCGQKPSGEEVSVSLGYALGLQTDQTMCEIELLCKKISTKKSVEKNCPFWVG
jgi:hypothetical protein